MADDVLEALSLTKLKRGRRKIAQAVPTQSAPPSEERCARNTHQQIRTSLAVDANDLDNLFRVHGPLDLQDTVRWARNPSHPENV